MPFERGPLGHSDGDVLCHALTDALLGGAGAGDIGRHFPNTDPAWKDAAGLDLLAPLADLAQGLAHPLLGDLAPYVQRTRSQGLTRLD